MLGTQAKHVLAEQGLDLIFHCQDTLLWDKSSNEQDWDSDYMKQSILFLRSALQFYPEYNLEQILGIQRRKCAWYCPNLAEKPQYLMPVTLMSWSWAQGARAGRRLAGLLKTSKQPSHLNP